MTDREFYTLLTAAVTILAGLLWVDNGCFRIIMERIFGSTPPPPPP
jgi:hypothetical protein